MSKSKQPKAEIGKYEPPKVSRWFKFDWQFAVDMSKLPLLRPSSLVIGFMPLLTQAAEHLFGIKIVSIPLSAWIMWWSSVAFIASWTILKFKCPSLIQDYRHYGEYETQKHSHRWIVWLFYNTITQMSSWQKVVQETLAKGISVKVGSTTSSDAYAVCPWRVRKDKDSEPEVFDVPADKTTVHVFYPENINRDLYVPIHCYGDRLLLLLQEDDDKLEEKEKELFWILYTQAAKEAPNWRFAFWALLYTSFALLAFNVVKNIVLVGWWMSLGTGTSSNAPELPDVKARLVKIASAEADSLRISVSGTEAKGLTPRSSFTTWGPPETHQSTLRIYGIDF